RSNGRTLSFAKLQRATVPLKKASAVFMAASFMSIVMFPMCSVPSVGHHILDAARLRRVRDQRSAVESGVNHRGHELWVINVLARSPRQKNGPQSSRGSRAEVGAALALVQRAANLYPR